MNVIKTSMNETMVNKFTNIVFMAIFTENNLSDLTKRISEKMRHEFNGFWQCFAYSRFGQHNVYYLNNKYITLKILDLYIIVFQSISN